MKVFAVLALVAAANAQAYWPAAGYTAGVYTAGLHHPVAYNGLVGAVPNVYSGVYANQYINQVPFGFKSHQVSPAGTESLTINKREAEADPLWYNAAYPSVYSHAAYSPVVYNQAAVAPVVASPYKNFWAASQGVRAWSPKNVDGSVVNDALNPFTGYAKKGQYVAQAPGSPVVHIAKREAESDAGLIVPSVYGYNNLAYGVARPLAYNYNLGYNNFGYNYYNRYAVPSAYYL